MDIKRNDVIRLWGLLKQLKQQKMGAKTAYAIVKNARLLDDEFKSIQEIREDVQKKFPEELNEFNEKRIELCKKFAEKDENGKPVEKNNNFVIPPEVHVEFDTEMRDLQKEYKEFFDKKDEIEAEFQSLLEECVDIKLHKVDIEGFSNEITPEEIEILEPMIAE